MNAPQLKYSCALASLALALACSDQGKDAHHRASAEGRIYQEVATVDGSNIDGHYQAKFITINPHVNGTIPGSANFLRKGDQLFAYVRLFAGGVSAWHMQFVYTGNRCPTVADDANGDGFIDIVEAEAVTGKILIPLDSDINTQNSGARFYPLADASGYYAYERTAHFRRFLSDLQDEDRNLDDDIVKLGPGQGLTLVGKVFMALGVVETVDLPDTVATKERRRPFQTLPIACGVFQKVLATPGVAVEDADIGPTAPVVDGEDQPAPGETPTSTDGSNGGSTGGGTTTSGTNESDDGQGPTSDGNGRTGGTSTDSDSNTNTDPENGPRSGQPTSGSSGHRTSGESGGEAPTRGASSSNSGGTSDS